MSLIYLSVYYKLEFKLLPVFYVIISIICNKVNATIHA